MDFLTSLTAYLPPTNGYLPWYMFTLSLIALGNSAQNYMTLHLSRRFYNGQFVPNGSLPPRSSTFNPEDSRNKLVPATLSNTTKGGRTVDQVTPLAARLFGTYTLISSIVRIYASYHLDLEPVYMMALWTYLVALGHFASEGAIFKTFYPGFPQFLPFFFATTGTVWMISHKGFYVES